MTFSNYISPITASTLVALLPLLAFLYQAMVGKRDPSGLISLLAIVISTVLSVFCVFGEVWQSTPTQLHATYPWFTVGHNTFTVGILLNNLTVLMQLLVCIIALPVHIYSRAYMKGDPGLHRYWMYLSLFCFAMLGLVISKNLLQLYIFWELVGFASYLLIGFWFTKDAAVQANKKAFLINRIGDLGFLVGIGLVFSHLGTLDLVELFGEDNGILTELTYHQNSTWLTSAGIAFFIGAMAKSAQFPFHVWLPDAMEGPTSVSSLIHAATMVAAGVFLLATLFPLFNATTLLIVTIIGSITALSASIFALAQYNIKKVLAFSTISQLGFMVVAIGIGAWDAAIFHLVTHAFFKCLLFLSAGGVIHEMQHLQSKVNHEFDPQDMRNMGGLRRYMPKTFWLMALSAVALSGFPLTSGFLSKDAIVISSLEWAIAKQGFAYAVPSVLLISSFLTAFYIGRLILKVFFGDFRLKIYFADKIPLHDVPAAMFIPMLFLGICSLFFLFSLNPFSYSEALVLKGFHVNPPYATVYALHILIPAILTVGTVLCWLVAWRWYVDERYPFHKKNRWLSFSERQGYLNELYDRTFVRGTLALSDGLYWFDRRVVDGVVNGASVVARGISGFSAWVDKHVVDGLVNLVAQIAFYIGHLLRWVQNGRLQNYFGFVFTVVLLGILYLIIA